MADPTISDLTVGQLIAHLQEMPQEATVRCWLPGMHIALSPPFQHSPGYVLIEGNVAEGARS